MLKFSPVEQFTEELALTPAQNSIVLIPERASSDALIEKLSSERIRQGWPHPGVFRFREFAQAVIKEADRSFSLASIHEIQIPSQAEQFLKWMEIEKKSRRFKNLATSYDEFQDLRRFHMVDLSFDQWKDIIQQIESNSKSELKPLTEYLLTYLEWSVQLTAEFKTPSYWSLLKRAARILSSEEVPQDKLFLSRVCSRPPFKNEEQHLQVIVLGHVEFYPLEHVLIEAIKSLEEKSASNIGITFFARSASETHASDVRDLDSDLDAWNKKVAHFAENLKSRAVANIAREQLPKSIIHFDHHASTRLVELNQSLGRHFKLNAETDRGKAAQHSYQLIKLWCDYQLRSCPTSHPLLRDQKHLENLVASLELDSKISLAAIENASLHEMILQLVSTRNSLSNSDAQTLKTLLYSAQNDNQTPHASDTLKLLDIFFEWGYFDFLGAAAKASDLTELTHQSDGVFFGELAHALPLGFPAALWTHPKNFKEYFNPLNSDTLKKDVFISHELDPLLEACGVKLPRFSRDIEAFWQVIVRNQDKIFFLSDAERDVKENDTRVLFFDFNKQSLSPSGLKNLLDCPARFYFQNLLKLEESKDWDTVSLDSSLRGQWIHFVLKALFEEGMKIPLTDEKILLQFISDALKNSLPTYFSKVSSTSYQALISKQIPELTRLLTTFYKDHRKLSDRHLGPRSSFCELKLDSSYCEQPFRFIADRLDVTAEGDYIIWDYKTGSTNTTKLPTAIKNNFIQLPLYKELVDRLPQNKKAELGLNEKSRCLGFGYLSPLKREKSVYYFTAQTEFLFKGLAELDEATAHPLIPHEAEPLTQQKVLEALQILQQGEFIAEPRKKNDCFTCPARFACGRPFLARDVDEETSEEVTP